MSPTLAPPSHWDIFCQVVDNYGDIGVCWRLACELQRRGVAVRLWLDDAAHLPWLKGDAAPDAALPKVFTWGDLAAQFQPGAVLLATFGCALPPLALARAQAQRPLWLNVEHLSAEGYVERMHLLPSPHFDAAGQRWDEVFFYPGFTPATGGLLREADLPQRQAAFDAQAWLQAQGWATPPQAQRSLLFAYEPEALTPWLHLLQAQEQPQHVWVCAGRGQAAFAAAVAALGWQPSAQLSWTLLPFVSQSDFDHLLWAADVNMVRGEDSWLRALWAGQPFVWQIYEQDDGAHEDKLAAFMQLAALDAATQSIYRWWNGLSQAAPTPAQWQAFTQNQAVFARLRQQQMQLVDLCSQLLAYAAANANQ